MLHTHEVDGSSPPVSTTRKSLYIRDFRVFSLKRIPDGICVTSFGQRGGNRVGQICENRSRWNPHPVTVMRSTAPAMPCEPMIWGLPGTSSIL